MLGVLLVVGVIGAALVFVKGGGTDASAQLPASSAPPGTPAMAPVSTSAPPRTTPAATTRRPATSPRASGATSWPPGNGVFDTADASGKSAGSGRIRRYEVQVEQGTGVDPDGAANEIAGILADPRGWTADGHDAFQLVSGGPHDFEVKIASPATVDAICGAAGLHTHGEVNCDVGDQVIVNLKRWKTGSPEFTGPVTEYRALIINHEVGHRIGHGHETCPGPGRPAPAMMQQIDGLKGCLPNAWPYDRTGHYLGGPPVP